MFHSQPQIQNAIVYIEQEKNGYWSVTDADHRFGGVFGNPNAAIKFAREEAEHRKTSIVIAPTSHPRADSELKRFSAGGGGHGNNVLTR
ncbi:hypothetical protein [Hyphomicrobium sp. 2TAF46]|uniref:hypothetical protein n=1 Tax=Hyphomicrobium sp. 2TAF46 TaxID=3233019 RepID=UPI003F8FB014